MLSKQLFETALTVQEPWFVKDIQFDSQKKCLDIYIDFHKGAVFHYESEEDNINGDFKAYDTQKKQWRHLNFFEHEVICMPEYLESRLEITT